jgi:outer membrane protein assembly factor BamA
MGQENPAPGVSLPPPGSRYVKRTFKALFLLVGGGVVLVSSVLVALRFPFGQQAALRLVSAYMEKNVGVRLEADTLHLRIVAGRVEIEGLRFYAATPDTDPFLEMADMDAEVRWNTLLNPRILIPEVVVREARLDLGPPMFAETETPSWYEKDGGMPVEIPRFEITGIEVVGPVPGNGETWLEDWRLTEGRVTGVVRDGGMVAGIEARLETRAVLPEESEATPWQGEIRGAAEVGQRGDVQVSRLEISGPGARASGSGSTHLASLPDLTAEAVVRVEPGRWWKKVDAVEGLDAEGSMSLAQGALRGELRATADAVPGEVLDPLLAELGVEGLETTGKRLELDADIDVALSLDKNAGGEERFVGRARAAWKEGDDVLLTAEVQSDESAPLDPDVPRRVGAKARIRPGTENSIEAEGSALLPAWSGLEGVVIEKLEVVADVDDIGEFLSGLWRPPPEVAAWIPKGSLDGKASVEGPVRSPSVAGDFSWRVGDARVVEMDGRWPAAEKRGGVEIAARLLPSSPGRREVRGTVGLRSSGVPVALQAEVSVPDLAVATQEIETTWAKLFPRERELAGRLEKARESGFLTGRFDLEAAARGDLARPAFELAAEWLPDKEQRIEVSGTGEASFEAPFLLSGSSAEISLKEIDLAAWTPTDDGSGASSAAGRLTANLSAGLDDSGRLYGEMVADLEEFILEGQPWLDRADLAGRLEQGRVTIDRLAGRLSCIEAVCVDATFSTSADLAITPEINGRIEARIDLPGAAVKGVDATLVMQSGEARLEFRADDLSGRFDVLIPLGTLAALVQSSAASEYLDHYPAGAVSVGIDIPDIGSWASLLLPPEDRTSVAGALYASAEIDPSSPLLAVGEASLEGLRLISRDGTVVEADRPVRLVFGNGRVAVPELTLSEKETDTELVIVARAVVRKEWAREDPIEELITDLGFRIEGSVDSDLLNPYLQGAVASGELIIDFEGNWKDAALATNLLLEAPESSILVPAPYLTRIENPRIFVKTRGNEITVEDSAVVLNRGEVRFSGRAIPGQEADLTAEFEDVRYRVDYGLHLLADGQLTASQRTGKSPSISGRVVLEKGLLRRDVYLDLELLRTFSLGDEALAEERPFDPVELDIEVFTEEGVSIDNNVAELDLHWPEIRIGGTMGQPVIAGRVEAAAGGWLEALGVLLRVDELSVEVFDDPSLEPEVQVAFTTLMDDPTLYDQRRKGYWFSAISADTTQTDLFFGERAAYGSEVAMTQLSASVADYFGDTLSRFVGAQGSLSFSVQPFPLYGSTDSGPRFTVGQSLGRYARLIASSDPQQTESEAYILEVADLLPRTTFQLFSSSWDTEGATVQIVRPLDWRSSLYPRLRGFEWQLPEEIKKSLLARSVSLRKGDPVPPDAEFEVEIEVLETLRSLGYPGSSVSVTRVPIDDRGVRLRVGVRPGPRAVEEFLGIRLPFGYRRLVIAGYLPSELDLGASLIEVRKETERSLRRLGYFRPRVRVEEIEIPGVPFRDARFVRVSSGAERKVEVDKVTFPGMPEADQTQLAGEVESTLARLELAEGLPGADRRLKRIAGNLGYADLEIVSRRIDEEKGVLEITVNPGPRQVVASYEVVGLADRFRDLGNLISLSPGVPLRRSLLAEQGRAVIKELRRLGYARAKLDLQLTSRDVSPEQVDVKYIFTPGPHFVLGDVTIRGEIHTDRDLLDELITLEPEKPYRDRDVAETERTLFRTSLFELIRTKLEVRPRSGEEQLEDGFELSALVEVEEGPRHLMSYGGSWETTRGASAILDLIDRNAFGRGQTAGARFVVGEERDAVRAFYGLPRTPGPRSTLEFFAEWSNDRDEFSCQALERAGFSAGPCIDENLPELLEDFDPKVDLDFEELRLRGQLTFSLSSSTNIRPFFVITQRKGRIITDLTLPDTTEYAVPGVNPDDVVSPVVGLQLSHDTRMQGLGGAASKGLFLGLQISGSHRSWGSDVTVLDSLIEAKSFLTVGRASGRPIVWAQRIRAGTQFTRDGTRVPVQDQYVAGGSYSLRGYPEESFGPGQVQLLLNEEIHFPLWSELSGVAFFDTGNVWSSWDTIFDDVSSCNTGGCGSKLFSSVGVGLRFSAFRLDYAIPLDQRPGDPDYQLFFGFGSAF